MAEPGVSPLTPESQSSSITEPEVIWLQDHFGFPPEFEVSVPGPEDRVTNPPHGRLAVYQDALWGGFRLPVPEFIRALFRYYQIVPAQLTPNSIRVIVAFAVLCFRREVPLTLSLFRAFFLLRKNSQADGWWFFGPRPKRAILKGLSSSIHGWREKFFFVGVHAGWGFDVTWREPYVEPNKDSSVAEADFRGFRSLMDSGYWEIPSLLSEDRIFEAGLSPKCTSGSRGMKKPAVEDVRNAVRKTSRKGSGRNEGGASSSYPKRPQLDESGPSGPKRRRSGDVGPPPPKKTRPDGGSVAASPRPKKKQPVEQTQALPSPPSRPAPAGTAADDDVVFVHESVPDLPAPVPPCPERVTDAESAGVADPGPSKPKSPTRASGYQATGVEFGGEVSALKDPETAIELFRNILLPADVKEAANNSLAEITESMYPALTWLIHASLITKEALTEKSRRCSSLGKTIAKMEDEKKSVEERLRAADEQLKKATEERLAAEARADRQARRVSDLEAEAAVMKADLESGVAARGSLQAELNRERAEGAQRAKELREAIALSADRNAALESLSGRLAAAEQRVEVAKVGAVEAFKDSQEFADAVAECSADSYRLGFADCQEAASRLLPRVDFSCLHPPGESSDEEVPEEEEREEEEIEQRIAGLVEAGLNGEEADAGELAATAPAPAETEEESPPIDAEAEERRPLVDTAAEGELFPADVGNEEGLPS